MAEHVGGGEIRASILASRAYVAAHRREIVARLEREKPWRRFLYGFYYFFRRWPLAIFTGIYGGATSMAYESLTVWWVVAAIAVAGCVDSYFVPRASDMRQSIDDILDIIYVQTFNKLSLRDIAWRPIAIFVVIFAIPTLALRFLATDFAFNNFWIYYILFYIFTASAYIWIFYKSKFILYYAVFTPIKIYNIDINEYFYSSRSGGIIIPKYFGKILTYGIRSRYGFILHYTVYTFYASSITLMVFLATPEFAIRSSESLPTFDLHNFLLFWFVVVFMLAAPSFIAFAIKCGLIARAVEAWIDAASDGQPLKQRASGAKE